MVFLCIYLSIYLSIIPSICLSRSRKGSRCQVFRLQACLNNGMVYKSIHPSVYLSIIPSICLSNQVQKRFQMSSMQITSVSQQWYGLSGIWLQQIFVSFFLPFFKKKAQLLSEQFYGQTFRFLCNFDSLQSQTLMLGHDALTSKLLSDYFYTYFILLSCILYSGSTEINILISKDQN